jgi:hypothetical protein
MAAFAHGFKRSIDLAECGLGNCGILAPLGNGHQRDALIAKTSGPIQGHALARPFLQRLAIGGIRLFELRGPPLKLPEMDSALPRLFWVLAQSSGTRSRVCSSSASR